MRVLGFVSAAALILTSSMAYGGLFSPVPVEVDVENRLAFGDPLSARFSDNDVEFIGCGIRASVDEGPDVFAFCQASNADGEFLFCSTLEPVLIDTIRALADFTFIVFAADENAECTFVGNSTQSLYIPESLGPRAKRRKKW